MKGFHYLKVGLVFTKDAEVMWEGWPGYIACRYCYCGIYNHRSFRSGLGLMPDVSPILELEEGWPSFQHGFPFNPQIFPKWVMFNKPYLKT